MSKKKKKEKIVEYSKLEHKVAALWTRVSTEKQERNNCSLETQERVCRAYAEAHGITIKRTFGGTHESAKVEGKKYKEMIASVANDKEINIILVFSFDRFSRAGEEALMTKAYLKSKGIYVVSATQATDPDTAVGKLMENMIFLFNQFENNLRRDKCVTGMIETLRKGYWYSTPPIGFDRKKLGKEHIITVNEKGRILRKAFLWKANEGCSDIEIVRRLKELGLTIDRKHLCKIFHNPFYCGKIQHNLLGDEIIQGKQEILIDEETWNKINGISRAGYEHQEITEEFPLKRHIKCSDCGGYLTGYTTKGKQYYKCNKKGCKSNHRADKLHEKYACLLDKYKISSELTPIFTDILHKVFNESHQLQSETRSVLKKQLSEIEQEIKDVQIRFGRGKISDEIYETTSTHLREEKANIQRGLERYDKDYSNLDKYVKQAISFACNLGTLWNSCNFTERQELQNLVFPEGINYDKTTDSYRTITENEALGIMRRFSTNYNNEKQKATNEMLHLSPYVEYPDKLSNFFHDFERIADFIKNHPFCHSFLLEK